jgi:hypothetical protein
MSTPTTPAGNGPLDDDTTTVTRPSEEVATATGEATAEPVSEATAEPVSEATAEPVSEATAEPVSEVTAEPTAEQASDPTAEPEPEPTRVAQAPDNGPLWAFESAAEPEPEPTSILTTTAPVPVPRAPTGPHLPAILLGLACLLIAVVALAQELGNLTIDWGNVGPLGIVIAGAVLVVLGLVGLMASRRN